MNRLKIGIAITLTALFAGVLISGCGDNSGQSTSTQNAQSPAAYDLTILSASENKTLEPIIKRFADSQHVGIKMDYSGSVDMALQLQNKSVTDDAIWPANSLWITLGDKSHSVKDAKSIMKTPVVLGVKKSVAEKLGWIGKTVTVEDILNAAQSGKLRYMMTSATQSNSGASAYMGYLYAFSGSPEMLSLDDLHKPALRNKIQKILGTINRSSGSSGFLKDLFESKYDNYDGMVNYESVMIETDQDLVKQGKEPLYVIYPVDGLAIADSPLGYIDNGNATKSKLFHDLQAYLLSPAVQNEIQNTYGRRTGLLGMQVENPNLALFNPDWGIDTKRVISPIHFPSSDVIQEALNLYQTSFRKPSFTVYCLDYSGSMEGERNAQLNTAMHTLLNQEEAKKLLLQTSSKDVTVVIPFNSAPLDRWIVNGNNPKDLQDLVNKIAAEPVGGGTDIYDPVSQGLDIIKQQGGLDNYFPAVILMTDGESNSGSFEDLQQHTAQQNLTNVPVFAIQFGDGNPGQLKQITDSSSGKLFDGTKDLNKAFREAKGYN
jgi:Ca-activated chloride channel family protein